MDLDEPLTWEGSYALARALRLQHPGVKLEAVSLNMLYEWILALPDFDDDPGLANEEILLAVYQEWLEEGEE